MCQRLFNCPRIIRSIICLFLACILVFCFIAPPYLQAYAVVDIILSGAISSTMSSLFALSGIQFASSSDLISGIELAWHNFDNALKQKIRDASNAYNPALDYTEIPLSVMLLTAVTAQISKVFPFSQTSVPSLPSAVGAVYSPESYLIQSLFNCDIELLRPTFKKYKYCTAVYDSKTRKFNNFYLYNELPSLPHQTNVNGYCKINLPSLTVGFYADNRPYFDEHGSSWGFYLLSNSSFSSSVEAYPFYSFNYSWVHTTDTGVKQNEFVTPVDVNAVLNMSKTGVVVAPPTSPDVINPADLTYTADKSICVDGVLTKAMDDVLAKNPSKETVSILVPADAADFVDAKLKDVVVDKELSDAIDREIANTGSGTVTGDITLPTVGELSLPARITTVFPFSIPWDISRGLDVFKAEPVAPYFEIPFIVSGVIDTKLVLDFTRFDFIIRLIRWGELILFIVGLALLSRKVIRW